MNTRPYIHSDGFITAKVSHIMGGRTCPLALVRYGSRYFFRDLGPSEVESRCSFSVSVNDLRRALDQADDDRGTLGDVLWMGIMCEGGLSTPEGMNERDIFGDEEDECECEEPLTQEEQSEDPKAIRRYLMMKLEDFL